MAPRYTPHMAKKKNNKKPSNTIAENRRARHDYTLEERFEAARGLPNSPTLTCTCAMAKPG